MESITAESPEIQYADLIAENYKKRGSKRDRPKISLLWTKAKQFSRLVAYVALLENG